MTPSSRRPPVVVGITPFEIVVASRSNPPEDFERLIEASSLGDPAAKALRDLTPDHVAEEILRRVAALDAVACLCPPEAWKDHPDSACPFWDGAA